MSSDMSVQTSFYLTDIDTGVVDPYGIVGVAGDWFLVNQRKKQRCMTWVLNPEAIAWRQWEFEELLRDEVASDLSVSCSSSPSCTPTAEYQSFIDCTGEVPVFKRVRVA